MALSYPVKATAPTPTYRPLSQILIELAEASGERVSLGEIIDALSDRSFAPLLLLFAAPNILPLPPGSSTLFAIPLILLATQLLLGWRRPWLPRLLGDRSLDRARFKSMTTRLQPYLQRFEKLARPRYWMLPQALAERFVGLVVLVMALVLILPIPLGNSVPAWAIMFISLGLSERDGVWLAAGAITAAGALGLVLGILGTIGFAADRWVQ
jgi:hypothetical protein